MIKLVLLILLISTAILPGPNKSLASAFKFGNPERCKFVPRCRYNVEDSSQQIDTQKIVQSEEEELAAIAVTEEKLLHSATRSELVTPESCDIHELADVIRLDGVVRVNKVIQEGKFSELTECISKELQNSIQAVKDGKVKPLHRFSNMLSSNNRWDLKLPLDEPIIMENLRLMFRSESRLSKLLMSLVTENGELFELAAFCTSSGAGRQVVHADTLWSKQPALYTCTLALQDINVDMGPTLFIPGSHTKAIHKKFDSRKTKDEVLTGSPHVLSTLKQGDMAVYDSRVLHCGTSNRSQKDRILLYATFKNPKGPKSDSDFWNVASIRPEYEGKYCLGDFM